MRIRRGQAAMEFLMTYGWAIIAVIFSLSALAYFGVLKPSNTLPLYCSAEAGFYCSDFGISIGGLDFVIGNSLGRDIIVDSITFNNLPSGVSCDEVTEDITISDGKSNHFSTSCSGLSSGDKFDTEAIVSYKKDGSTIERNFVVSMMGEVEDFGINDTSCGDGICNGAENCSSCPSDCGACGPSCGNAICEVGETCSNCADCGCEIGELCCEDICTLPLCAISSDCNDLNSCTNDICNNANTCSSTCTHTPKTPCCGNGVKETGETCSNCPADVSCGTGKKCCNGVCILTTQCCDDVECGLGRCCCGNSCLRCPCTIPTE